MGIELVKNQFGWSVWLKWVAATVASLALAGEIVRRFFPIVFGFNVSMVVVTGIVVMGLVGIAQGLVLRRYGVPLRAWIIATLAGSILVIALAALITLPIQVPGEPYVAVEEYDAEGNFIWSWTGEEIAPGNFSSLMAIADGAVGHLTPSGGSVAAGSLGSGVHIGDFDAMMGLLAAWLIGGASLGFAQWFVLRRYIKGVGIWIPATMLGKVAAGISASIVLELMTGMVISLEVPLIVSIAGIGVYSGFQATITGVVLARRTDERIRWGTGEKVKWVARIITLVIAASSLIMWIQNLMSMQNEGFKFDIDNLLVVVPSMIALSGCIVSWWREQIGGSLLILASVAYGILLYISTLQHQLLWSMLALFLNWLILGSVFLIAGILFIVLSRLSDETA
jgi:hypothetical protein